jgi:hypothetical protein
MTLFKHIPKKIPNEVQNLISQYSYGYKHPKSSNPPKYDNIIDNTKPNNASRKKSKSHTRRKRTKTRKIKIRK